MIAYFEKLEDAAQYCAIMIREGCCFVMQFDLERGEWKVTHSGGF